jgi:hypothetical protein
MHVWNAARSSGMDSNTRTMVHNDACQECNRRALVTRFFVQNHLASECVALPVTPALKCDYSHSNPAFLASLGRMESRFAGIFISHLAGEIRNTAKLPLPGNRLSHLNFYLCATWRELHSGSGPIFGSLADSVNHSEAVTMLGQWSGRGLPAS